MITIEELFEQPFEPEWMTRKKRLKREQQEIIEMERRRAELFEALSFNRQTGAAIEDKYRSAAAASRLRIAARCNARGNYQNGLFTVASKNSARTNKRKHNQPKQQG